MLGFNYSYVYCAWLSKFKPLMSHLATYLIKGQRVSSTLCIKLKIFEALASTSMSSCFKSRILSHSWDPNSSSQDLYKKATITLLYVENLFFLYLDSHLVNLFWKVLTRLSFLIFPIYIKLMAKSLGLDTF